MSTPSFSRNHARLGRHGHGERHQRGVALFVGLIFLVVLSLLAVFAMKGTLLEMHMVNNVAAHERAFQTSETLRAVPVAMFDQHVFNRGWPEKYNFHGGLPPDDFAFSMSTQMLDTAGKGLRTNDADEPINLYEVECRPDLGEAPNTCQYDPASWIHTSEKWNGADMRISICPLGGTDANCMSSVDTADIYVRPDGTVLTEGSGGAQATGYRGPGTSAAGGGASAFFEIMSVGHADGGRAVTLAQYRQAIRN